MNRRPAARTHPGLPPVPTPTRRCVAPCALAGWPRRPGLQVLPRPSHGSQYLRLQRPLLLRGPHQVRHGLPQQAGGVLRAAHGGGRLRPRDGPPRGAHCGCAVLPDFVPLIGRKSSRTKELHRAGRRCPALRAVSRGDRRTSRALRAPNWRERFRIRPTRRWSSPGVDRDAKVEAWLAFV